MKKSTSTATCRTGTLSELEEHLGMNRSIARRDFLNGTAIGIAGALGALNGFANDPNGPVMQATEPQNYPPLRSGLRGQYPAASETFETLRSGKDAQLSL